MSADRKEDTNRKSEEQMGKVSQRNVGEQYYQGCEYESQMPKRNEKPVRVPQFGQAKKRCSSL